MSNYATKSDLKNAKGADISQFTKKKNDLTTLKSGVDKLDIDKLEKLDVRKLVPVPKDLSKLSDVGKNEVVKKDEDIEDKITSITNVANDAALDAKIN